MRADEIIRLWQAALRSSSVAIVPSSTSIVYIASVEQRGQLIWLAGPVQLDGGATVGVFETLGEVFDFCRRGGVAIPEA